jgi:fumarate hydratase class II
VVAAQKIAEETDKPFVSAPNKFAALSDHDAMVAVAFAASQGNFQLNVYKPGPYGL